MFTPGYLKSVYDPLDWSLAPRTVVRDFPQSYSVPQMERVPVFDQGKRGTCVACAAVHIKEWQELVERQVFEDFSVEYIYDRCKEIDGYSGPGTYPRIAMSILRGYGVCSDRLYPYRQNDDLSHPNETNDADAVRNRIASYARVYDLSALKSALIEFGPVLIGIGVYSNWFTGTVQQTGLITTPSGNHEGGHALIVFGWNPTHLLLRNSWGTSWGIDGNGYLPIDYPGLFDDAWLSIDLTSSLRLVRPSSRSIT